MANKIKSLMDEKKSNGEILTELGIAQSQLTNYKRVIVLGKINELSQGKPLIEIIKENQGVHPDLIFRLRNQLGQKQKNRRFPKTLTETLQRRYKRRRTKFC